MIEYLAFAFRQNRNAPINVTFVATSCDIDEWAKVPTRLSNRGRHFQRAALPNHVREIEEFFAADSTATNSSPTSILLGVDPGDQHLVTLRDSEGSILDFTAIGSEPVLCKVKIDFTPWDSSVFEGDLDAEITALHKKVVDLPEYAASDDDEEEDEDDEVNTTSESEEQADTEEIADEEEQADETTQTSDIPPLLSEERRVTQFFARITPHKLMRICEDQAFSSWPVRWKEELIQTFKDDLKPALIIDGQHRVKGTRGLPEKPFVVSFLPDASWGELAFQFIVNNHSARKVDEDLLFGIVGESLSEEDLEATDTRLNRSGIKVSLIQAAMRVQVEPNPFRGMLRTGKQGEAGFLDATAMKSKVIELWYGSRGRNGGKPSFKKFVSIKGERRAWSMRELFSQLCGGSNDQEKAEFWQRDLWFQYFRAFWEAISEHYSERLWPQAKPDWLPNISGQRLTPQQRERQKLMRATVLGLLQRAVLQAWADSKTTSLGLEGRTFADDEFTPAEFKKQISFFIARLTTDFFTELQYTGFDASKPLREEMMKHMLSVLENQKKMADLRSKRFWQAG